MQEVCNYFWNKSKVKEFQYKKGLNYKVKWLEVFLISIFKT